jgi:hypothetical protein
MRMLAVAIAALTLAACAQGSAVSSSPGIEKPIHAQARGTTGVVIDVKCWRILDDNGKPTALRHVNGADPHWTEKNPAERDCLPQELDAAGWHQGPDGYWARG